MMDTRDPWPRTEEPPVCPLCDLPIAPPEQGHYGRIGRLDAPPVQIHAACPGEVVICEIPQTTCIVCQTAPVSYEGDVCAECQTRAEPCPGCGEPVDGRRPCAIVRGPTSVRAWHSTCWAVAPKRLRALACAACGLPIASGDRWTRVGASGALVHCACPGEVVVNDDDVPDPDGCGCTPGVGRAGRSRCGRDQGGDAPYERCGCACHERGEP